VSSVDPAASGHDPADALDPATPRSWRVARSGPVAAWTFLRLLGAIYGIAFLSILVQIDGLIGPRGILPAGDFLRAIRGAYGPAAYWYLPTVFWWSASTPALLVVCGIGVVASACVLLDRVTTPALLVCWIAYLSIVGVGQEFLSFQWDSLLLEAGVLAVLTSAWPTALAWLYRWLLFRLMFMSGIVKLVSGDSTWRNLTALTYHFETQPLPNPISWYVHQLPPPILEGMTAGTLVVETLVPFMYFGPRRVQAIAAGITVAFQGLIFLTGNYTFFNLLTMALALWLLDDDVLRARLRQRFASRASQILPGPPAGWLRWPLQAAVTILVLVNAATFWQARGGELPASVAIVQAGLEPLRLSSGYGLFAVMTTTRPEIDFEGSDDGVTWTSYAFYQKPGDERRAPPWVAPYHPRLDWQMWFAALSDASSDRWVLALAARLLEGSPPVRALLAPGPWSTHPPRYIRATLYDYRFSDWASGRATGAWWIRHEQSPYLPPLTLDANGGLRRAD
jgi:hypothetical protein